MKKIKSLVFVIFSIILLSGYNLSNDYNIDHNYICLKKLAYNWSKIIDQSSQKYHVDKKLIQSIICIESSGNSKAISSSNAIGLMQIKPFSAGREVYRYRGKLDQPSRDDLYNPKINIDIGTAYINILQNKELAGIHNPEILRYAIIVSYVNGSNKLLTSLSKNRQEAIKKINSMTVEKFLDYIKKNIQKNKLGII